ncbi:MAG: hypothetical protein HY534_08290 [Chloroflexi bacterium]|nr:hypothetical protein [Chloroflexota bacterium]
MTRADEIRDFVFRAYLEPARRAGGTQVVVRAGDVARQMGLRAVLPSVCGALGSNKFEQQYRVRRLSLTGPSQGSNAEFTFELV